MALIIAGERSGVGKTTVTLTLLSYLSLLSNKVQSFKVGPDYIDPMFHRQVTKRPCRNLDPLLTSESYVKECFTRHCQGIDYALVEGVMGLFDGASGQDDYASTAHLARLLQLPVLLVIDCSRLSRSVAAIAHGYRSFDPRIKLAGVVLNRVGSDRHLELLKEALEPLELPILGVLRRHNDITIPSRHLGLVPTAEIPELKALIDRLAELGRHCFNWQKLLPLLQSPHHPLTSSPHHLITPSPHHPRIAVAYDQAFSFYYQDNLDILQQLGAELIFWSPLRDASLPESIQGLYFGGGFPEVFAQELTKNTSVRAAVKQAILTGIPTYAECGGLMYLSQEIKDFQGLSWSMVGVLPTATVMGKRLNLGYRQATTLQNSPLLPTGTKVWGHEFHRSQLMVMPEEPLFELRGYRQTQGTKEGWVLHQLHASYLHLHWGGCLEMATRFVERARNQLRLA